MGKSRKSKITEYLDSIPSQYHALAVARSSKGGMHGKFKTPSRRKNRDEERKANRGEY